MSHPGLGWATSLSPNWSEHPSSARVDDRSRLRRPVGRELGVPGSGVPVVGQGQRERRGCFARKEAPRTHRETMQRTMVRRVAPAKRAISAPGEKRVCGACRATRLEIVWFGKPDRKWRAPLLCPRVSPRDRQPFDYPALLRTSRPSAPSVKPGSEKRVASSSGMASRSSGVTLVPDGVCSLRDSSLQSHSNVPVPSSPRTPTIGPVTNSGRGCVEVH